MARALDSRIRVPSSSSTRGTARGPGFNVQLGVSQLEAAFGEPRRRKPVVRTGFLLSQLLDPLLVKAKIVVGKFHRFEQDTLLQEQETVAVAGCEEEGGRARAVGHEVKKFGGHQKKVMVGVKERSIDRATLRETETGGESGL